MRLHVYSYRYAQEILEHPNHRAAWDEIFTILSTAPLFVYPGKSRTNPNLNVVQQLMNTWFDRRFAVDAGWLYHPRATQIEGSALAADYRKTFPSVTIQAEVQFGNMARWYSDVFKLQAAYAQSLIQVGLCVVPTFGLARAIDSNVTHYERVVRELPAAQLSITLPILVVGLEADAETPVIDVSRSRFGAGDITGKGRERNRWRLVHGQLRGEPVEALGPDSPTGPMLQDEGLDDLFD